MGIFMLVFDDIYISDKLIKKKKKIISALRHGKMFDSNVFVIYLNTNTNLPEIMQGYFFNQIYFQSTSVRLLGLTDSKDEAINYLIEFVLSKYSIQKLDMY